MTIPAYVGKLGNPGSRICGCGGCEKIFNSENAFMLHRNNGSCLTSEQMSQRGMEINKLGRWIGSKRQDFSYPVE